MSNIEELQDEQLKQVNGGTDGFECDNYSIVLCSSNISCTHKGKSRSNGGQYDCCILCGQNNNDDDKKNIGRLANAA